MLGRIAHIMVLFIALTASMAARADVDIALIEFGVGSTFRPGDPTAIRVQLTSNLTDATQVFVQWEVTTPDGDTAEFGRSLALTPNLPTEVWLYAPLLPPPHVDASTVWGVRVIEDEEDRETGRELGFARISPADVPNNLVEPHMGMIGLIGTNQHMGLNAYDAPPQPLDHPFGASEFTRIVPGISPEHLPDRWEGLYSYEAIVWGTGSNASPLDMRIDPAAALREYVRRGRHLIITLAEAGDQWNIGRADATHLSDLFPTEAPRIDDDVHVSDLLPILSRSRNTSADFPISVRVFAEADGSFNTIDNSWSPLLALPDGRVVAIQRTYGHGRMTLLGIDVSSARLLSLREQLPHADVFWNRVLGRRADTPNLRTIQALQDADLDFRGRHTLRSLQLEDVILESINMQRHAGMAVILSLFLFAAYWIIAGPAAFFALRHFKLVHWSWVAYAGAALVFTVIAWASVNLIRDRENAILHLSVIDHIARRPDDPRFDDPQLPYVRSWFSVYLPRYGASEIELEPDASPTERRRNLLIPWQAVDEPLNRFPNADRVRIDIQRRADAITVPSRSTTVQLFADWQGVPDETWTGIIRVDPNNEVREVSNAAGTGRHIAGSITNSLPYDLTDVHLVLVSGNRTTPLRYLQRDDVELPYVPLASTGRMLNLAYAWGIQGGRLESGRTYDLSELTGAGDGTGPTPLLSRDISDRYMRPLARDVLIGPAAGRELDSVIEMLSIYHHLDPPRYMGQRIGDPDVVVHRRMGRELDLSAWLSRPCVIVIGYLDNTSLPIPTHVDGAEVRSEGRTVVRWIYPLPIDVDDTITPAADAP